MALTTPLPMTPAGGLFIMMMGVGVVLGGLLPPWRKPFLMLGAAGATAALMILGPRLVTANPTATQLWFLVGSIALEAILIRIAIARYKSYGERTLMLAILVAVGLHFIPMAFAFGVFCFGLGVACTCNALTGLHGRTTVSLDRLWLTDGCLKIAFGAAMVASVAR
jgi:hypothetical protein